jgi:diguanylate cyclase (GGDEF)-like protein/putative nucleotidyltransferase with HDIG domain
VSGIENIAKGKTILDRGEFLDALRRDICQILEFDFGQIDLVNGTEIATALTFCNEEKAATVRAMVGKLTDANEQPLLLANTPRAQQVKQTCLPWVDRASVSKQNRAPLEIDPRHPRLPFDEGSYPFAIVPIFSGSAVGVHQVKGLLRVVSLDSDREISKQDLSTLRLIGEHLANRITHLSAESDTEDADKKIESGHVLIVHANRPVRRRFSRVLATKHLVIEAENAEKAIEQLKTNEIDLVVLDNEIKGPTGEPFCKALKESNQWPHLPIILVAPDTQPTARIDGLNLGAEDCVSETCLDPELLARVRSSLRHSKAERELSVQLQLLEDYAKRLEKATERLATDGESQQQKNQELKLARWESEVLRMQDTLLHRISNTVRRSFNIEQNLTDMLEELTGWLNLDCCFIVMPTPDEPEDSIRCEYATKEEYGVKALDLDLKALEVYQRNYISEQSLIVKDATVDRSMEPYRDALSRLHILSVFFVPITYEEKLLGILVGFKCESEGNWTGDNETFLKSVADQIATAVINARLYARVQRQATTDGLTGLFNHRTGQEKLAEQLRLSERYQRHVAVLMLDVDHFKSINDSYGHPAGDTVLKNVAKLIQRDCRDVDLPVRYGGEEFLLVLPEVNTEGAMIVAERIRKNLAQTAMHHEGIEIRVTASMGVAAYPEDAQTQQALLDLADKSLYLSKRLGRNQVHAAGDLMFEEPAQPEAEKPPKSTAEVSTQIKAQPHFVPPQIPQAAQEKEELVPEVVEMVKALASTLYAKSEYNKVHHLETARISELLARVMGLSKPQVEQIRVAGLLHDVGTLSLPSDLLSKEGAFTEEERQLVNQHPVLGAELLRPIRALRDICEILENHHERWDGTGYPRGLKGEQIPLPARILSIVDSYHAMISDRPYRPAMTPEQAVLTLKGGAGTQWDPFLVDIFITVLNNLKQNQDPSGAGLNQI